MELDFTEAEDRAISAMVRGSKKLPDDFWGTAAMQELACLYAKIEPLLTDAQRATIIGCGALLVHYSRAEFAASIEAAIAIGRATASNRNKRKD